MQDMRIRTQPGEQKQGNEEEGNGGKGIERKWKGVNGEKNS